MSLEIEKKYLEADFENLTARLEQLGCQSDGWHFESNVILDTPGAELYKQGKLLRLRKQAWPDKTLFVMTFKTPVSELDRISRKIGGSNPGNPEARDVKIREELEMEIPDFEMSVKIFSGLGYKIWAKYEKFRQIWHFPEIYVQSEKSPEPELAMDILPFARVVEMEGTELFITQMEVRLGLDKLKKSSTNYHKLHQQWRRENSLPPQRDFIFEKDQKEILEKKLILPD